TQESETVTTAANPRLGGIEGLRDKIRHQKEEPMPLPYHPSVLLAIAAIVGALPDLCPATQRNALFERIEQQSNREARPKKSATEPNEWTLRGRLMADPHNRDAHEKLCALLEKRDEFRASVNERRAWLEDNSWDSGDLISLITIAQFRLNDPEYAISATRFF